MTNGHDFDAHADDELRRAQAAALEAEVRALNAERALEHLRDEIASLRAVALGTPDASWQDDCIVDLETQFEAERDRRTEAEGERDFVRAQLAELRTEHARCVPLAGVQQLLARCEARYAEGATASDVLDLVAWFVVARAAAAKAEGGETGGE